MPQLFSTFLTSFGLATIKAILIALFKKLELIYPGSRSLFESIINFLEGGGSAPFVEAHLNATLPGFKKQ